MTNDWSTTWALTRRSPDDHARVATIPKPAVAPTSENYFDALATKRNQPWPDRRDEYPGDPDHDPSARFNPEVE